MKAFVCVVLVVGALLLPGCTDGNNAKRILAAQGYKQVKITGYEFFGCSEDDFYHTGFRAVGANGQSVSGVVCQGIFKGATVRIQ